MGVRRHWEEQQGASCWRRQFLGRVSELLEPTEQASDLCVSVVCKFYVNTKRLYTHVESESMTSTLNYLGGNM